MWIVLPVTIGLLALGLYTKKGKKLTTFVQVFIETLQSNKCTSKNSFENLLIDDKVNIVKYGPITLNSVKSTHHYDVLCFTSSSFNLLDREETHNYNPGNDIETNIPYTLIRSGNYLASIPFRPYDYKTRTIFIGVKHLSCEKYSIYRFENKEVINLLEIFERYENSLLNPVETECESLAEAYD